MRLGPVYLAPRIGIDHIGFDTNVYNSNGERQSDFTATVWGGLRVDLASRKLFGAAEAGAGFAYYARYKTEQATNPRASAQLTYRLTRKITLAGDGRFGYVKSRPSFEIDERLRRQEVDGGLSVGYAVTPRFDLDVRGRWYRVKYDRDGVIGGALPATGLDRRRNDQRGSLGYKLTPYTSVFGAVEWRQERFSNDATRDGRTSMVGGGFTFTGRGLLSGEAEAGQARYQRDNAQAPGYTGLYGRSNVTLSLRDTTELAAGYQRNVDTSHVSAFNYYVYDWSQAEVRRALFRGLDMTLSYSHFDARYAGSPVLTPAHEVTQGYGASVGYHRGQSRYALQAWYTVRRSDVGPERQYNGWRLGFTIRSRRLNVDTTRGMFLNGTMPIERINP